MHTAEISKNVFARGVVDWDRRLFDSLIPLPDGTSYNAYVIRGAEKTALLDTVDPTRQDTLIEQLGDIERLDYVVSHHSEQDHSGAIPAVLESFPEAQVIASPKGTSLLVDHLHIDAHRCIAVGDGESIDLGDKTLRFFHTPWVHWPETMITWLAQDGILFTCDFFGSHLATTDLYVTDRGQVYEAAKRYYAEIMMPFRKTIRRNLDIVESLPVQKIAPSHGPMYDEPSFILDAYRDWTSERVDNSVVIPYISMHGSTRSMAHFLVDALAQRGITVYQFDLAVTDLGKLAIRLVDAASIVIGTPTVHVNPHPIVYNAVNLANALKPKLKFASIIGSYGWGTKAVETIASLIPNLRVEVVDPVICKGAPRKTDFASLDNLADEIAQRHRAEGLL
jgi:flavorubredoxin